MEAIVLAIASRLSGSKLKLIGLVIYVYIYNLALIDHNVNVMAIVLATIWVHMWKITGHADGFRDYERDNFLSFFIVKFTDLFNIDRMSKTYDSIFWTTKGYLIALLPSILLGNGYILLFSMFGYPLAYYLGYEYLGMQKQEHYYIFDRAPKLRLPKFMWFVPTVWGELLAGFFAGLGFLFL